MKTPARLLVVLVLLVVGAPVEQAALAAAQKRSCNCSKPALRRKTRARTARSVTARANSGAQAEPSAAIVGPVFTEYTLPANQIFRLRLNELLSSERSRVGDRFTGTVLIPVYAGGVEVVPAGATVEGRVTQASAARSRGREGRLAVAFDTIALPDGTRLPMEGALTDLRDQSEGRVDQEGEVSGRSSETRNIGYIGGGTAGGAVLGGVLGGGKGAGIGAAIGAGAGVAGVMLQKGHDAELRSGTEIGMITTEPITFRIRER